MFFGGFSGESLLGFACRCVAGIHDIYDDIAILCGSGLFFWRFAGKVRLGPMALRPAKLQTLKIPVRALIRTK